MILQEFKTCGIMATRLELDEGELEDTKKKCQEALANIAVLRGEAILISIATDEELSHAAKQVKISKEYDRLSTISKDVGADLKAQLCPRLVKETVGKMLLTSG